VTLCPSGLKPNLVGWSCAAWEFTGDEPRQAQGLREGMHGDVDQEIRLIRRALADTKRRVVFKSEVATLKSLRQQVGACQYTSMTPRCVTHQ
jgi:hypothetical protein